MGFLPGKVVTVNEPYVVDALAEAAVAEIQPGMVVGVGTGKTCARAVLALANRVRDEGLVVHCVPTSHVTETLARSQRLNVLDFALVEKVDYLFDGADEIDEEFRMLKGLHGAIARQRLVARVASRRVYVVGHNKFVHQIGTKATLPVAIMPFAMAAIRSELRNLGLSGVVRRTLTGELFLTDHAHLILDVMMGGRDPHQLADALDHVPGVVEHGLFLEEADEVLVEHADGSVERRIRQQG
jgi:ribose 5-phosphate isomerase A